jgi:putative solute:sodium symporter small subunit
MPDQQTTPPASDDLRVNFFRPRAGFMRREVTIIWLMLSAWGVVTFGFPLYLALSPQAQLTGHTILGMPVHYCFSGQFLIIWFILICVVFNLLIDRLTASFHKRRQGGL